MIARRLFLSAVLLSSATALPAQKLKVYVLAGQSNMQGHARIKTFDYIGEDPKTAPLLAQMRDADGKPRVCDDVWVSYLTGGKGGDGEGLGKLTAGFGARTDPKTPSDKIGPEFTFGLRVAEAHDGPVLLIKTAWGGKSLNTDFRSPSAGPFRFPKQAAERLEQQGKLDQQLANKKEKTGHYYRAMIAHVKRVLGDIKRVCPAYDPAAGYELAGFVWFQGWNDMVARDVYPDRDKPGGYREYSECLAHFIRDVRKDLGAPGLPFVIGVMGVNGKLKPGERYTPVHSNFRAAMAVPAAMEEFKGNVAAVQTADFWDEKLQAIADKMGEANQVARERLKRESMSKKEQRAFTEEVRAEIVGAENIAMYERGTSNQAYHYLGCGKTMAQIGRAFAEAVLAMQK